MKLDIEKEIGWMQHFRRASSLTEDQFDAELNRQRGLMEKHRADIEKFPAWEKVHFPTSDLFVCYDCGAIGTLDGCPICSTVDHKKLPKMAWGVLLEPIGGAHEG